MRKSLYILFFCVLTIYGMISCSDDNPTGGSISPIQIEIVKDSSFVVTGESIENPKVQSRTITQLLGIIKAKNFGELSSDIVTQFMPSFKLDTVGVYTHNIDSLRLTLRIPKGGFTGDSIVPMKLNVYRLNKQLPSPIYSDFNPGDYYSKSEFLGSTTYSTTNLGRSDSIKKLKYYQVDVMMPRQLGVEIYQEYKKNPDAFYDPSNFAKFFPGVYITTSYGSGRVVNIENTEMTLFYRQVLKVGDKDTTYLREGTYMAVTPEIITNNNIKINVDQSVSQRIRNGEVIIQAPAAYEAKVQFPIQELIDKFQKAEENGNLAILNNLYFEVPTIEISNDYGIDPPKYLLLVKASEKDEFFLKNKTPDNKTSFYAVYDSKKKMYIFSDMREYMYDIIHNKGAVAPETDKVFTLTPVDITIEESTTGTSSGTITNVAPYVSGPAIVRLDFTKAKIRLTYSRQTLKGNK